MNIDEIITKVESRFCDLDRGDHETTQKGCIMGLISWAAGEPWSDFPACVPRGVALHCQRIHDSAKPAEYTSIWTRDRLAGVLSLPRGEDAMRRRAYIAVEHARAASVRKLRARGIDTSAIDACAPATNRETAIALRDVLRDAAYAAATYATSAATYAATYDADADADADAAAYATYAAAYAATTATTAAYAAYAAADAAYARQRARIEILDLWIADARLGAARKGGA